MGFQVIGDKIYFKDWFVADIRKDIPLTVRQTLIEILEGKPLTGIR